MCALLWQSCQLPVSHSCSLLNHPNSFCGGMFRLNTKFDADMLLYLLSHFECDSHIIHILLSSVSCTHWLVHWSHHCSRIHIPVHSLGCQVTSMSHKLFSLCEQWLDFFWTDLIFSWRGCSKLSPCSKRGPYTQKCKVTDLKGPILKHVLLQTVVDWNSPNFHLPLHSHFCSSWSICPHSLPFIWTPELMLAIGKWVEMTMGQFQTSEALCFSASSFMPCPCHK